LLKIAIARRAAVNRQVVSAAVIVTFATWLYPDGSFAGGLWSKRLPIYLVNGDIKIRALGWEVAQRDENTLTPEQRQIIIERARAPRTSPYQIIIASDASCADCVRYARAFQQALGDAGWIVRFKTLAGAGAGSSLGRVALMVSDLASPPSEAITLRQALISARIDVELTRAERDFHDFPDDRRPVLHLAAVQRQR
jgi:hypothetical protein